MSTSLSFLAHRFIYKISVLMRKVYLSPKTLGEIAVLCTFVGGYAQAGVTFSNPRSSTTVATFSSTGTYVISCAVSDSVLTTKQSITIQVSSPIPAILIGDNPTGIGGNTVLTNISFSTGTIGVSSLQFNIVIPSSVTISTASIITGSAAISAGKSVSGSVNSGLLTILVFGINQTVIPSGTIVSIPLNLSASLPAETANLTLSGIVASDPNGVSAPMNGQSGNLSVIANAPPIVTISGPSSVVLPATASLSATAADDGAPNPPGSLTYQWSSP